MHQAIITATVTDATPGIITALLADARTDDDTHDPARKNPAKTAIRGLCFRCNQNFRDQGRAAGRPGTEVTSGVNRADETDGTA